MSNYNKIIFYPKVRNHFVPDEIMQDVINSILESFDSEPFSTFKTNDIFIDPGGLIFTDTIPFKYTFDGITFSVKPEHILLAIYNWGNCKQITYNETQYVSVTTGSYDVIILSPECYKEVGLWLRSLNGEGNSAMLNLASRLSKIKKIKKPSIYNKDSF